MTKSFERKHTATFLVTCMLACQSLFGCGGSNSANTSSLPPIDDSARGTQQSSAPVHHGMSGKQKVALLVGAAALYYMYKKNQQAHQSGSTSEPQYYLSKNGRVYYREQGGRVHWVTAPSTGIQVPEEEASQYQDFQGYQGRSSGRDLAGIGSNQQ